MKTVILGQKIENVYSVDSKKVEIEDGNNGLKLVYTDKPQLTKKSDVKEWVEICSYEGEPRYNKSNEYPIYFSSFTKTNCLNISEDKVVTIKAEIFRADLNEVHLRTSEIVEETDVNKGESEEILNVEIRAFNSMMITSNDKLKSYCDVHKLPYEDTDAIELFKIVFPDEKYEIVDGVMKVKKKSVEVYVTSARDAWDSITSGIGAISMCNNGTINITKAE